MFQTLKLNGLSLPSSPSSPDSSSTANSSTASKAIGSTPKTLISIVEGRKHDVFDADEWTNPYPAYRGSLLNKLANLMEEHKDDLIALGCANTGNTVYQCSTLDLPGSVGTWRYYAGWTDKVRGETAAVGSVGRLFRGTFPMMMFTWKIAPALVTGNTVIIKSAEATPLSALKICDFISQAGFPLGTLNLVSGYRRTVRSAITHHMNVDKVAFTSFTATGRAIMRATADQNLKKVTFKLGGKSPVRTRIYVHEDVYEEFLAKFTNTMSELTVGHLFNKCTNQGPQNSQMQYDKNLGGIDSGIQEGATVHLGSKAIDKGTGVYYIQPTIFTNIMPKIYSAPLSNNRTYGLAAGCHTKDYERAIRVINALRAMTTWESMYNVVHWSIPFGGYKESRIGGKCGEPVLENYTQTKVVYLDMGMECPRA
ncbi:Aldehyde/histidinol dehydrogenase [Aspergillus multicolor]|uniref:Aldehyde/histidinol dehydrogenase n=1 Tax=Aspergillus multicolor TaxID=41759 RepID=UPI003CCD127E